MDEEVHKISLDNNPPPPVNSGAPQVMDVKRPAVTIAPPMPTENSISPEDGPASPPLTPAPAPSSPVSSDPAKDTAGHDDKQHQDSPALVDSSKMVKVLAIVIVALALIAVVLFLYMKHK